MNKKKKVKLEQKLLEEEAREKLIDEYNLAYDETQRCFYAHEDCLFSKYKAKVSLFKKDEPCGEQLYVTFKASYYKNTCYLRKPVDANWYYSHNIEQDISREELRTLITRKDERYIIMNTATKEDLDEINKLYSDYLDALHKTHNLYFNISEKYSSTSLVRNPFYLAQLETKF